MSFNNDVYAITFDSSGDIYAGGFFSTAGGVSANRIAKWNGTQWSSLGGGMNSNVNPLVFDSAENLYVGGFFTISTNKNYPRFVSLRNDIISETPQ